VLAVEHSVIHVDIDDLRAAFHLLAADVERLAVFVLQHQLLEFGGTGNIGAFADVNKQ
jgi:hypothetical protein